MHREEPGMSIQPLSFLRRVLLADAASCAVMGLGMILFAATLADLMNLPALGIADVGLVLLPCAAFIGYLASKQSPPRIGVWVVIVLNVLWAVESFALLFTDWVSPNALGVTFIAGQALVVALFAELEYVGLRRAAAAAVVRT
jgi:hypothetical protein